METQAPPQAICSYSGTRCDACACGACARGKTAEFKLRANNRDALMLLEALARRINESQPTTPAKWGHVGSAADVRERLLQVAMSFALGPDGEEAAARRRLEEALCAGDESGAAVDELPAGRKCHISQAGGTGGGRMPLERQQQAPT